VTEIAALCDGDRGTLRLIVKSAVTAEYKYFSHH